MDSRQHPTASFWTPSTSATPVALNQDQVATLKRALTFVHNNDAAGSANGNMQPGGGDLSSGYDSSPNLHNDATSRLPNGDGHLNGIGAAPSAKRIRLNGEHKKVFKRTKMENIRQYRKLVKDHRIWVKKRQKFTGKRCVDGRQRWGKSKQ